LRPGTLGHSQVLEVATGELLVGDDVHLAIAGLGDDNGVAEVTGTAINLDAIVEELLEGGDVEDLVVDRLRGVDGELKSSASQSSAIPPRFNISTGVHTFLVIFCPFFGPPRAPPWP
jgi:hypothetical protein